MSRMHIPAAVKVALLTMVVGLATISPAAAVSASTYEKLVHQGANHERTSRGLTKLSTQKCVDRYAERQAKWMSKHTSLTHQSLWPIMKKCKLSSVAENIARGYPTAAQTVQAWMDSPGHRANMLSSKMRIVGIGAVRDRRGQWWVSMVLAKRK